MIKTIAHFIGPLAGTIVVFLILKAEIFLWTFFQYDNEYRQHLDWMFSDLYIFGTILVFGLIVQFAIVRPLIYRWKRKRRYNTKKILVLGIILSLISGFLFGSLFGSAQDINDILITTAIGILVFAIYYLIAFWTFLKL